VKDDDLSDILGGSDTPATKVKGTKVGKKDAKAEAAAAAVKSSAAKHKANGKDKPAKAKAAPAKAAAKPQVDKKGGAKGGHGKFNFPADVSEAVQKKIKGALKEAISTKELGKKLSIPTWQIRLAAVKLEEAKALKIEKTGGMYLLKPR
jgi:hypothetical protein